MGLPLREARDLFETQYLQAQLLRFGGNISRTAQFVGMERSALHRKLKQLGVNSDEKVGGLTSRGQTLSRDKARARLRGACTVQCASPRGRQNASRSASSLTQQCMASGDRTWADLPYRMRGWLPVQLCRRVLSTIPRTMPTTWPLRGSSIGPPLKPWSMAGAAAQITRRGSVNSAGPAEIVGFPDTAQVSVGTSGPPDAG